MRINYDMIINVSSFHEIDEIYNKQLFSVQVSVKHRFKYINVKKMLAILHIFLLWHEHWTYDHVRLVCDNSAAIDAIHKHFIKDDVIHSLQVILLIVIIFDIEFIIF